MLLPSQIDSHVRLPLDAKFQLLCSSESKSPAVDRQTDIQTDRQIHGIESAARKFFELRARGPRSSSKFLKSPAGRMSLKRPLLFLIFEIPRRVDVFKTTTRVCDFFFFF